jgi:hypothetical protein
VPSTHDRSRTSGFPRRGSVANPQISARALRLARVALVQIRPLAQATQGSVARFLLPHRQEVCTTFLRNVLCLPR